MKWTTFCITTAGFLGMTTWATAQVSLTPPPPAPMVHQANAEAFLMPTSQAPIVSTSRATKLAQAYGSVASYNGLGFRGNDLLARGTGCAADTCSQCGACSGGCDDGCSGGFDDGCSGGCRVCSCNLGDAWTLMGLIHGDCPPATKIGGWTSMGYHDQGNDLFNDRPDKFALHQGWLYVEKVPDGCSSCIGFRADVMYGIDANDTQAFGNPSGSWDFNNGFDHGAYGWAIPQAYVEVALGNWRVKTGHFFSPMGYEVVAAPGNFFYSHAMTKYNSEPFTHTGVLATGRVGDKLEVHAGWTLGWDTGFDRLNDGDSWLGGLSYRMSDNASFTYIAMDGNFGARGDDGFAHSIILDFALTDRLNWVVQSDLLRVDSTAEDNVGINQYFLYTMNDCMQLGSRVEWWKADGISGYAPHGAIVPANENLSYYAATFGANIRPHANLVLRPEVRVDWSPAANYDEVYFGIDAVMTF